MQPMPTFPKPKLQEPGAGLPWLEGKLLRFFMPKVAKKSTWEECQEKFLYQTKKIEEIIRSLTPERLNTPILIPRLKGLEDSSRFWSIAMTVDHLRITAPGMTHVILGLCQGTKPDREIRVKDVKPPEKTSTPQPLADQFVMEMLSLNEKLLNPSINRESSTTGKHPWFGEITAKQWNWVIGAHQSLHRQQMMEILRRL